MLRTPEGFQSTSPSTGTVGNDVLRRCRNARDATSGRPRAVSSTQGSESNSRSSTSRWKTASFSTTRMQRALQRREQRSMAAMSPGIVLPWLMPASTQQISALSLRRGEEESREGSDMSMQASCIRRPLVYCRPQRSRQIITFTFPKRTRSAAVYPGAVRPVLDHEAAGHSAPAGTDHAQRSAGHAQQRHDVLDRGVDLGGRSKQRSAHQLRPERKKSGTWLQYSIVIADCQKRLLQRPTNHDNIN